MKCGMGEGKAASVGVMKIVDAGKVKILDLSEEIPWC